MSDIRIVDGNGELVKEPEQKPVGSPTMGFSSGEDIDTLSAAQVLGLESETERRKYGDDLKHLIEWAKQEGYENPSELKWIIRSLMSKLGTPAMGEPIITRASRYAYLQLQGKKIQQEQESLLR